MPTRGGSKGRKKPSIRDLSHEMPTDLEGIGNIIDGLDSTDPRSAALTMGSVLDFVLERALALHFVALKEDQFNALFRNPYAPLSSFSAKIALAHALGIYDDEIKRQLDTVRIIRNAFAHSIRPISFDEPLVAQECRKLNPALLAKKYRLDTDSPRERFIACGNIICAMIGIHAVSRLPSSQASEQQEP